MLSLALIATFDQFLHAESLVAHLVLLCLDTLRDRLAHCLILPRLRILGVVLALRGQLLRFVLSLIRRTYIFIVSLHVRLTVCPRRDLLFGPGLVFGTGVIRCHKVGERIVKCGTELLYSRQSRLEEHGRATGLVG